MQQVADHITFWSFQSSLNQLKCEQIQVWIPQASKLVPYLHLRLCPDVCWTHSISHSHLQTDIFVPKIQFVTNFWRLSKSRVISRIWIYCTQFWRDELNKINDFGLGTKPPCIVRWYLDLLTSGVEKGRLAAIQLASVWLILRPLDKSQMWLNAVTDWKNSIFWIIPNYLESSQLGFKFWTVLVKFESIVGQQNFRKRRKISNIT